MDTAHITVAKIVATPLDTSWAQAYSAGKLYIALSLQGEATTLAVQGKETIEKLQREFFALDEKSLATVKKAVEAVTESIEPTINLSLVVSTIVESALYIIIVNSGSVLLKRHDSVSLIAKGEASSISSFSGKCEPHDTFLITTEGFLKTVVMKDIESAMQSGTSHEIGEGLAPFIHENATGTEAALVLTIGGGTVKSEEILEEENNDHLDLGEAQPEEQEIDESHASHIPALPHVSFSAKRYLPKKITRMHIIIGTVIILLLILGGSILMEHMKRETDTQNAKINKILSENETKYEEATAVMSLNKSLATEELTEIKTTLEKEQPTFPQGSEARGKLDGFLAKVNDALGGKGSTSNSQISVFLDAIKESGVVSVLQASTKGGDVSFAGNSKIGVLNTDGSVKDTFNGIKSPTGISATEENIFVLSGNNVSKVSKTDGKVTTIIEDQDNPISIATFGDNVYLLSEGSKTIYKYRPNAYAKEEYFTKETTLTNPSSIAIDSSIYVVDDGKIRKFTRGAEDTFNYSGGSLSKGSLIYTDEDYSNLYVVDPVSKTFLIIDKTGALVSNVSLKGMKTISSITANEPDKKAYVTGDNKIYSISF